MVFVLSQAFITCHCGRSVYVVWIQRRLLCNKCAEFKKVGHFVIPLICLSCLLALNGLEFEPLFLKLNSNRIPLLFFT